MNSVADHWWLWLVALLVLLAFIWLMRARRKPGRSEADLRDRTRAEAATEHLDTAASTGAAGLAPEAGSAAEAIVEEARAPAAASGAEAAPERAPVAAPSEPPVSSPPPSSPAAGGSDNLQLMKGVGPKLATRLNELGITRFDQIAGWSDEDIAEFDQHLGTFKGRAQRDNWVEQAAYLARGDKAGFEAKYGALGAEIGPK